MKRMLINELPSREVRVAVIDSNGKDDASTLHDLHIEQYHQQSLRGNIYKARIAAVKDELGAAFVDYGDIKQGLLSFPRADASGTSSDSNGDQDSRTATSIFKPDEEILVQVNKDPRRDKGAALTTQIQLLGQHVILTTNRPTLRISRMITGAERTRIERILSQIELPSNAGLVVRTSASGKDQKMLQQDVDATIQLLTLIRSAYDESSAPRLLYQENNMVNTVLRDNLHANIEEILIDSEELHRETNQFVDNYMPDFQGKIIRYESDLPLFTRYKIEKQSNKVFDRSVTLPSGGEIVLDPTEALLSVDVNSARTRFKSNFEEMALNTNIQAVEELFKQMRLRDIGGLIVVDFIDMQSEEAIKKLEDRVEKLCQQDRARTKWEPLSKFGLMQLQRRRMRSSIYDAEFEPCTECAGHGNIRTVASIAHTIFREIEAKSYDHKVARIATHVTPTVSSFLTNELRAHLSVVEMKTKTKIEIVPDLSGDNATYVTHSYRSMYSQSPRQTVSYDQGRQTRDFEHDRKRHNRDAPAESIRTAAVARSDVERKLPRAKSKRKASSQVPARLMTALSNVPSSIGNLLGLIYRRLFVIEAEPQQPKRGRNSRRKTSSQKAGSDRPSETSGKSKGKQNQQQSQRSGRSQSTNEDSRSKQATRTQTNNQRQRQRSRSQESSTRPSAENTSPNDGTKKQANRNAKPRRDGDKKTDQKDSVRAEQGQRQRDQERKGKSTEKEKSSGSDAATGKANVNKPTQDRVKQDRSHKPIAEHDLPPTENVSTNANQPTHTTSAETNTERAKARDTVTPHDDDANGKKRANETVQDLVASSDLNADEQVHENQASAVLEEVSLLDVSPSNTVTVESQSDAVAEEQTAMEEARESNDASEDTPAESSSNKKVKGKSSRALNDPRNQRSNLSPDI